MKRFFKTNKQSTQHIDCISKVTRYCSNKQSVKTPTAASAKPGILNATEAAIDVSISTNVMIDVPASTHAVVGVLTNHLKIPTNQFCLLGINLAKYHAAVGVLTNHLTNLLKHLGLSARYCNSRLDRSFRAATGLSLSIIGMIALLFLSTHTSAQTFMPYTTTPFPQVGSSAAAWGDYNNDGDADCLITGTQASGEYVTQLFRNNGDGSFTLYHSFTPVTHASVVWGDVNGDNYLDFHLTGLTATSQSISELYINQRDETFVLHPASLEGVAYGASALADIDQDGDLDLLYTGANDSHQNVCKLYENQDSLFVERSVNIPGFSYGSLDVADYNRDGRIDLLFTGLLENGGRATRIYRNEGHNMFTSVHTTLPDLSFGEAVWGEFNHDGYADIALSGITNGGNPVSKIYQNNHNEVFTDVVANLQAVSNSSITWLDEDNDGYSDLFITGLLNANAESYLYRNDQHGRFHLINNTGLLAIYDGDMSLTDHNSDGQMDVFISGYNNRGAESRLHTNTQINTNAAPIVPNGLLAFPSEDSVQLHWKPTTDAEMPDAGIAYHVYVGTAPGKSDIVPAHALLSDGRKTVLGKANAGYDTTLTLNNLPEGRYYWAVQAVDASAHSSAFSVEGTFDICYAISLGEGFAVCAGDTVALQLGKTGDQVDWQSAGGIYVENQRSVTFPLYQTDTIFATLTNPLGCVLRDTLVIRVIDLLVVDLGIDTSLCAGEVLTLSAGQAEDRVDWYSVQQGLLAADTTDLAYLGTATDTLWVAVTNVNGCVSYDTLVVNVHHLPVADAGADQLICHGENTILGTPAEAGYSYQWQPAISLVDATVAQPTAQPDTTTTYVLQVTNKQGCINYDTITITVNPPSILDAGADRSICLGESTSLGGETVAQGAILKYRYEWFPKASLIDASAPNPVAIPDTTTRYRLIVQAGTCEPDTAYVMVTVNYPPTTSTSEDITIGAGETTQLKATGGVAYHWFPAEGLSRTDVADPFASPSVTTNYEVIVTNQYGCSSLDTVVVQVDNRVFVPNLFSPDNNGQNDTFKVYGTGIETLDLQVYDRQGKRVYHSGNVTEIMETGWDGTLHGAPLPIGNYRWVIQGQFYDGKPITFEGANAGKIRLIR